MTESLLLKIEEKVMLLLAEITNLRQEVSQLKEENAALVAEQGSHSDKLHELLSLLDIMEQDRFHEALNLEGIALAV